MWETVASGRARFFSAREGARARGGRRAGRFALRSSMAQTVSVVIAILKCTLAQTATVPVHDH